MMKKIMNWALAATLICGANFLVSCKESCSQKDSTADCCCQTCECTCAQKDSTAESCCKTCKCACRQKGCAAESCCQSGKCTDKAECACTCTSSCALQEVQTTELFRTSQSWDGAQLPDYPKGRPELVAIKYEIPAGAKLGWHDHPVMNFGILVQGDLTIIGKDGKEKTVHEGEGVVEMVNTTHHGENRGTKPVVLYMFYASQKDQPLSVQHPEIPMDYIEY